MITFFIPMISKAIRCSLVCGCGHCSFAATSSSAPSIIVAPLNIVAISDSWPGASTNDIFLRIFVWPPHFGHLSLTVYPSTPLQDSHFLIMVSAYPNLIVIPLFISSE